MWYLEVDVPAAPAAIQLVRASVNSLEIQWPIILNANQYLLQIQKIEQQQEDQQSNNYLIYNITYKIFIRL